MNKLPEVVNWLMIFRLVALVEVKGFSGGCHDVLPLKACLLLPLPLPSVHLPLALSLPLPLPRIRTLSPTASLSPPESVSTGISDVGVSTQDSKIFVSLLSLAVPFLYIICT